jgi:dUTP pyrophosphatase
MKEVLKVKKLSKDAKLPEYILGGVGFDLVANEDVSILPLEQKTVGTGLAIQIPDGFVGIIRDRVGIVTKMGVHTAAGTFDPAYRGEVSVILVNFGEEEVLIERGMGIAQMIIVPVVKVSIEEVKKLDETVRGGRIGITDDKEVLRELMKITKK